MGAETKSDAFVHLVVKQSNARDVQDMQLATLICNVKQQVFRCLFFNIRWAQKEIMYIHNTFIVLNYNGKTFDLKVHICHL